MATEKQSESVRIHYCVALFTSFPRHVFTSVKLIRLQPYPLPLSLEPDPINQKYPEDYRFHEDGFRGQTQGR